MLPSCVCRIWGCNTSNGNGGWWWSMNFINEVMKIITFKKILNLKAPCEIIGGWQFGDIGEIDYKEGMLRILGVLDGKRIVGGREGCIRSHWGEKKKKRKKIGPRRLGSWYYVELERELLRNNDLTFPLIKNEYIYTKMGIIVSYQKHKNRKQS